MNRDQIEHANRDELIEYLESWGFQCYDYETTSELRHEALENHDSEN